VLALNLHPVLIRQAATLKSIADMTRQFNERFEEQAQTASEIRGEIRSNHHEMQHRADALETENIGNKGYGSETSGESKQ